MPLDTETESMTKEAKERINKRKIAFVYLMHRMFEGNPTMMLKILGIPKAYITVEDLQDWNLDYKEAVYQTIQEEDSRGVELRDIESEVPSIKRIKEKVLRRVDTLIAATDDPARLAQVYKILSEFEVSDDKKEKSVLDAINESIKPLTPKKKETITMLEKMRKENMLNEPGKKRRGRPPKVQEEDANVVEEVSDDIEEEPVEEEETINE